MKRLTNLKLLRRWIASKKRVNFFIVGIILLIAFCLRLWGIDFGLPQLHIIDEGELVYSAFYTGANKLRPLRYLHAPFIPYLLLFEYAVYFVFGKLIGIFSSPEGLAVAYLRDPTVFVLIGRVTMVMAGVAAVWLVWFVGKRFYSRNVGIMASFFLALTFLHVKESHYIKGYILAGFFILLMFYFLNSFVEKNKRRDLVLAGIASGLALATRYPAGLAFSIVLVAVFIAKKKRVVSNLLTFFLSWLVAFFLVNPYYILEFSTSIRGTISDVISHPLVVYPDQLQGKPVWWHYLFTHIPGGIGLLFTVVAFLGFIYCFLMGRKSKKYYLIPVYPLVFFMTVDLWTKSHFGRYAVGMLPFFALGAGIFLDQVSLYFRQKDLRKIFLIISSLIIIYPSFMRSVKFNFLISRVDTRGMGKKWIELNVPEGARILVESTLRPEYQSNLNVGLNLSGEQLLSRIDDAKSAGLPATYLKTLKKAIGGKKGYDIVVTPRLDMSYDIYNSQLREIESAEVFVNDDIEYIVVSSWARKQELDLAFMNSFLERYLKIMEFYPNPEFPFDPHFVRMDYESLGKVRLFDDSQVFGPKIEVYRIRSKK